MIYPILFIELDANSHTLKSVVNCVRSSIGNEAYIIEDQFDDIDFHGEHLKQRADFKIGMSCEAILEKWTLSVSEAATSIILNRVFSVEGEYEQYRDLHKLAVSISELNMGCKVFFQERGLKALYENIEPLFISLKKERYFERVIYWDQ